MSDAISPILQWLNAHPHLAGLATFIISAAESIAIIGTIVPGTVMMTAIGTLAGAGVIPLYSTIIWAILGAIVGDGLSYWAGYYFKDHLHAIWPFRKNPQLLASGERFFAAYGGASVFIGRFVGPVRALVPLVAGMLRMPPLRFTIANVVSAIGWAPIYMLPGILLGAASLELPPDIAVHVILVFLLTCFLFSLGLWSVYKIFALIHDKINQFLNHIWDKLHHSRFHFITTALKHHDVKKPHGQLVLAFYFTLTVIAFIYLAFYVHHHPSRHIALNNALFYLFRSFRTPTLDNISLWVTQLGEANVILPATLLTIAWLAWKKCWRTAAHALVLVILLSSSIESIKHLVQSMRPWGINGISGYSFPSGHTTLSTALYIGLGLLFIHAAHIRYKKPIYLLSGLVVAAISLSRLYLGAHWFTDVLGGWLLGAAALMLVTLSYTRKAEENVHLKKSILIAVIAIAAMTGIQHYRHIDAFKHNYTKREWPIQTVTVATWWQHTDKNLPLYRVGRVGAATEILNLQWLGDLAKIKALLLQQGWEEAPERGWIDVLHRITDVSSAEHLPLVSPLYLDKKPVLVLTKNLNGDKKLIVLRLWNSNMTIPQATSPLWVGSVGMVQRTYSWLFRYKNSKDLSLSPSVLFAELPKHYDIKQLTITTRSKHKNRPQAMLLIKPKSIS